jgi:flagellar motor switch protein FliN/FliY
MSETDTEAKEPDQEAMADEWASAMEEQADAEGGAEGGEAAAEPETPAEAAQFQELQSEGGGVGDVNLDAILDVPVTISMEIGRTKISIRNLLHLNQGSVVELD